MQATAEKFDRPTYGQILDGLGTVALAVSDDAPEGFTSALLVDAPRLGFIRYRFGATPEGCALLGCESQEEVDALAATLGAAVLWSDTPREALDLLRGTAELGDTESHKSFLSGVVPLLTGMVAGGLGAEVLLDDAPLPVAPERKGKRKKEGRRNAAKRGLS